MIEEDATTKYDSMCPQELNRTSYWMLSIEGASDECP